MAVDFPFKEKYDFDDLVRIMQFLRGPGGCPWDAEQTHQSLRKNLIEETYEAVEAIDAQNPAMLREELGDVLLQVVYHSAIEEEVGSFSASGVCDEVCRKLIRRHPHIFGEAKADTTEEVLANWEAVKRQEKGQKTASETLESVPKVLPGLMRAEKIQQRAARAGMDYDSLTEALADLKSEIDELERALKEQTPEEQRLELGDILFSAVNVSRFLSVDPEEALGLSCQKFIRRFTRVEQLARQRGIEMESAGIQKLDQLWREVKEDC